MVAAPSFSPTLARRYRLLVLPARTALQISLVRQEFRVWLEWRVEAPKPANPMPFLVPNLERGLVPNQRRPLQVPTATGKLLMHERAVATPDRTGPSCPLSDARAATVPVVGQHLERQLLSNQWHSVQLPRVLHKLHVHQRALEGPGRPRPAHPGAHARAGKPGELPPEVVPAVQQRFLLCEQAVVQVSLRKLPMQQRALEKALLLRMIDCLFYDRPRARKTPFFAFYGIRV